MHTCAHACIQHQLRTTARLVCTAHPRTRPMHTTLPRFLQAQLVARSLEMGRWVCLAPSLGRRALVVLGEVFRLETCGAADSSYVAFSSRWPDFSFQPDHACPPLFADRASLDAFVEARRLVCGMEKFQAWGYGRGTSVESLLQWPV